MLIISAIKSFFFCNSSFKMSLIQTTARVYADVLNDKPVEFFDYDNFEPPTEDGENYSLVEKLGRGKYSEVFEAVHIPTKKKVVVKILKPVRRRKIKREILILEVLRGGINIIELLTVVNIKQLQVVCFRMIFHYLKILL